MFVTGARRNRIEMDLVSEMASEPVRTASIAEDTPLVRANRAFFDLDLPARSILSSQPRAAAGPPRRPGRTATFRESRSGVLRTVYKEIVIRFRSGTADALRRGILARHGFEPREVNRFVKDQVVAVDAAGRKSGADLIDVANGLAELDEVVFATPNFVSEYRRQAVPTPPVAQWHLLNRGSLAGQRNGEDVDAREAWRITPGRPSVVIAILDDGVDVEHPHLASRIWRNPKKNAKDRCGRDFFLKDDHPDHFNPRPKKFRVPYDEMPGNDIHGTCCAGVAAAAGKGAYGVAWKCRILPVKIFHADDFASDARVADAIRYAATIADVLSCSWSGGSSPDVELAIEDALRTGRGGRGALTIAAAGNESRDPVGFPASAEHVFAVGASTDAAAVADYSNAGPELDVVAPSSGGVADIFTTDVSVPGRGFNVGDAARGDRTGALTNDFGGTSSATPLVAGVAALMLSANPALDWKQVSSILIATADKIGAGYDANGHSDTFGYGRVNAGRAVAAARDLVKKKPKKRPKKKPKKKPKPKPKPKRKPGSRPKRRGAR